MRLLRTQKSSPEIKEYMANTLRKLSFSELFVMPLFAPRLIYSTATVRGWWLPRWVPSQPLAEVRAATSDLLAMLSKGALTPPESVRYSFKDFQEAVRLADGEAGQEKVLLDFSEKAP